MRTMSKFYDVSKGMVKVAKGSIRSIIGTLDLQIFFFGASIQASGSLEIREHDLV